MSRALAQLQGALDFLNASDAASLPGEVQAEVLRELERAEARKTAARARYLAAFGAQAHYEADGQGTTRAWLKWQTCVTSSAAAGAVGWARRLAAHPVIDQALATGQLSASWAKHLCAWTDRLPEDARQDADQVLCEAAADGCMGLGDLGGLAEEIYHRTRPPGPGTDDEDRVFEERCVQLGTTLGGAGRVEGDLTPGCAHALSTVLAALGKKAGPEDTRTASQRRHDALQEACRRLITAGMVPGRAGQPTQLTVHMTLHQLLGMPGASAAIREWAAAQAATKEGWLAGPAADAAACDATIIPVVTGHLDPAALDRLTGLFTATRHPASGTGQPTASSWTGPLTDGEHGPPGTPTPHAATTQTGRSLAGAAQPGEAPAHRPLTDRDLTGRAQAGRAQAGRDLADGAPAGRDLAVPTRDRLRRVLLGLAIQALSGPGGLAAHLRAPLTGPPGPGLPDPGPANRVTGGLPAAVSLPLDIGTATPLIPAHLRKAAAIRHPHCAFPGCTQPHSACDLHHLIPRSRGGPTSLPNLAPLCQFHHLTAIHRWGWTLQLHADGTTTAISPDGSRVFHSHSPPGQAA